MNLNFIALILLLSSQQPARGVLIVEVRSGSHEVIGAQVQAGGHKAQTDDRGRTQLFLPAGTYSITIEAEAFQTSTTTVRVDPGAETRLEVELAPLYGRVLNGGIRLTF